jgi:restriction system protein
MDLDGRFIFLWIAFNALYGQAKYRAPGGARAGIDLVLRLGGRTFLVQCKHWRAYQVGVKEVREVLGLVTAEAAAGGILVTSGGFSPGAKDFARGKPLQLVDGPRLLELVQVAQMGQPTGSGTSCAVERATDGAIPPACPACGRRMVLRTAKRGRTTGSRFWGCSTYPACRATVDL